MGEAISNRILFSAMTRPAPRRRESSESSTGLSSGLLNVKLKTPNGTIQGARGRGFHNAVISHLSENHGPSVVCAWKVASKGARILNSRATVKKFLRRVDAAAGDGNRVLEEEIRERLARNPTVKEFNKIQRACLSHPEVNPEALLASLADKDITFRPLAKAVDGDKKARELSGRRMVRRGDKLVAHLTRIRAEVSIEDALPRISEAVVSHRERLYRDSLFHRSTEVSETGVARAMRWAGYTPSEIDCVLHHLSKEFEDHAEILFHKSQSPDHGNPSSEGSEDREAMLYYWDHKAED